jgi:hypothetical protein
MTYADRTGRPQDFDVKYRFFAQEEGGRASGSPGQGYRCDWLYDGDNVRKTGIYMIWPEFEQEDGGIIPLGEHVPMEGTARIWIVNNELRNSIHRKRLKEGVRGFFMEGGQKVAEVCVTKIIGLHNSETVSD